MQLTNTFTLSPADTNLPFSIEIGSKGETTSNGFIRVMGYEGDVNVSFRPRPAYVNGLDPQEFRLVAGWINLNEPSLLMLWAGLLDELKFRDRARPL